MKVDMPSKKLNQTIKKLYRTRCCKLGEYTYTYTILCFTKNCFSRSIGKFFFKVVLSFFFNVLKSDLLGWIFIWGNKKKLRRTRCGEHGGSIEIIFWGGILSISQEDNRYLFVKLINSWISIRRSGWIIAMTYNNNWCNWKYPPWKISYFFLCLFFVYVGILIFV